jgi:hypothetical protein
MSIGRALNCKQRIQQFCENHQPKRGEGIDNDRLKAKHWYLLEALHTALGPFYAATLSSEGNNKTLLDWFCTLDYVLDSIDASKNHFGKLADENPGSEEYTFLQAGAAASWAKVEEYYGKADASAAYYAANVLDPTNKWAWFEHQWENHPQKKVWLEGDRKKKSTSTGVKGLVQELWEEEYKGKYGPDPSTLTDSNKTSDKRKASSQQKTSEDDPFENLHKHKNWSRAKPKGTYSDHYMDYISTDPADRETDALEFWNARVTTQPDLARFALDMLAIPMMSAECERVFSSAKYLITDSRNRLKPDIIEANECLKHWFGKLEQTDQKPNGDQKSKGPASDEKAEASDEEETEELLADMNKGDESDVEDEVCYEVDSDGEVVWKD